MSWGVWEVGGWVAYLLLGGWVGGWVGELPTFFLAALARSCSSSSLSKNPCESCTRPSICREREVGGWVGGWVDRGSSFLDKEGG